MKVTINDLLKTLQYWVNIDPVYKDMLITDVACSSYVGNANFKKPEDRLANLILYAVTQNDNMALVINDFKPWEQKNE